MGKGDMRTRKGKIFAGSYGNTRPHQKKKQPVQKTGAAAKSPGGR
jgi:30S ribosomal protein S31